MFTSGGNVNHIIVSITPPFFVNFILLVQAFAKIVEIVSILLCFRPLFTATDTLCSLYSSIIFPKNFEPCDSPKAVVVFSTPSLIIISYIP